MSKPWWQVDPADYIRNMNTANNTDFTSENLEVVDESDGKYCVGTGVRVEGKIKLNIGKQDITPYTGQEPLLFTERQYRNGSYTKSDLIAELDGHVNLNLNDAMFSGTTDKVTPPTGFSDAGCFPVLLEPSDTWESDVNNYAVIVDTTYPMSSLVEKASAYNVTVRDPTDTANGRINITAGEYSAGTINPTVQGTYTVSVTIDDSLPRVWLLRCLNWGKYKLDMGTMQDNSQKLIYNANESTCYILFVRYLGKVTYTQLPPSGLSSANDFTKAIKKALKWSKNPELALEILDAHVAFLLANTGKFTDNTKDRFVLGENNNIVDYRHYDTMLGQGGHGNMLSTTTTQASLINGINALIDLYGTLGLTDRLEKAKDLVEKIYKGYISTFYQGVAPVEGTKWLANATVNGKAPILSHYPLNTEAGKSREGGFKNVSVNFVNGVGKIPSGSPYFGEYLDVVGQVYNGTIASGTILATPTDGSTMAIKSVHGWTMDVVDVNGNVIDTFTDSSLIGTITLEDGDISGYYNVSFACRVPVDKGGVLIPTGGVMTKSPIQVTPSVLENRMDGEQWFYEGVKTLKSLYNTADYIAAEKASLAVIMDATNVIDTGGGGTENSQKFFRQIVSDDGYDTDGNASYNTKPSGQSVLIGRDSTGYINITTSYSRPLIINMTNDGVVFEVTPESELQVTYGGIDNRGTSVIASVILQISKDGSRPNAVTYYVDLPAPGTTGAKEFVIPMYMLSQGSTRDYEQARIAYTSSVSGGKLTTEMVEGVFPDKTPNSVMVLTATSVITSFRMDFDVMKKVTAVIYMSTYAVEASVVDARGLSWRVLLPVASEWTKLTITDADWIAYSGNGSLTPSWGSYGVDHVTFSTAEFNLRGDIFKILSLNAYPVGYSEEIGYTNVFTLSVTQDQPGRWFLGDCAILGGEGGSLMYTPGIIPRLHDGKHAYIGGQLPIYYPSQSLTEYPKRDAMIENVIDFFYDAQQWFYANSRVSGPVASAYVWDSNATWEFYDTEEMHHLQSLSLYGAVALYKELKANGLKFSYMLEEFINNWLNYLVKFVRLKKGVPTVYSLENGGDIQEGVFVGDISGTFLLAVCEAYAAGLRVEGHLVLIESIYTEIANNFVQSPNIDTPMHGSWSQFPDKANKGENGQFVGEWSGWLLRGVAAYYKHTAGK